MPQSITGRIRAARPSSRTYLCSQVLEFAPFAAGFNLYQTIFPETDARVKGFWWEGLIPGPSCVFDLSVCSAAKPRTKTCHGWPGRGTKSSRVNNVPVVSRRIFDNALLHGPPHSRPLASLRAEGVLSMVKATRSK